MTTYYQKLALMLAMATQMRRDLFPCPTSDLYMLMCRLEQDIEACMDATSEGRQFIDLLMASLPEREVTSGNKDQEV